tara:strand:+ start:659 stop:2098 length:1440 start_codon:yes stop_codon:yes gene_type:complete
MPKIPTFEARGRPTAEAPSVRSGIQVSPSATVAAALLPAAQAISDYSIKKRDVAEKVEAQKKIFEIKGELDTYIESEKENINDENAINNFKSKFNDYTQQQLSQISNRRVRERIQQGLDLEYSEYVYNIKKNSYAALEKESVININNEVNSLSAKYATSDNPILKVKYKTQAKDKIRQFAQDFDLPENVLNKKLEAVDRDFLLADMQQLAGFENGAEQIKKLDSSLNATKFLTDEDFGKGIYNAYAQKISDITVKGSPDSDYDRALELTDELETFQRDNGYKISSGNLGIKINNLKEKLLTEKIQHDDLINKQGDNRLFFDYSKDLGKALTQGIADPFAQPEIQDRLASAEIESEYNETIKQYLLNNQDATLEDKKEFARSLVYSLKNIYENRKIQQVNMINMDKNTFDIQYEYQQVINDMKLLSENKLNSEKVKQYKTLAKLNGYTTKVNGETEGDLKAFINEYLPSLQSQIKSTLGQ